MDPKIPYGGKKENGGALRALAGGGSQKASPGPLEGPQNLV